MRSKMLFFACALALIMTACGTRLPNSAFVKAQQGGSTGSNIALGDQGTTDQGSAAGGGAQTSGGSAGGTSGGSAGSAGKAGSAAAAAAAGGCVDNHEPGVTCSSIKVGNVTAIQGQFGPEAFSPSLYGLQAYASGLNARGGINGRKIDVKHCDDRDDGAQNLACSQQLVEQEKVFAFLANNSQSSARSASYTAGKGVPDLGLPLNNGYFKYPTMFSFYPPAYPRDGKKVGVNGTLYQDTSMYRWFKQQRHIDRGAVFFYTIAVSRQQGLAEAQLMKTEGINPVYYGGGSDQGENVAAPSFDTDVVNMKSQNVQGIWDAMDAPANEKLCQAMDRQSFTVTAKISTIEVWGQSVGKDFSAPCRNSVYSQGLSIPYGNSGNPLVAQFLADFNKYESGHQLHQWALEGWSMGKMFTDAVQAMGANVTRAGFIKWLNSLDNYTQNGLLTARDGKVPDFSKPSNRCFSIAQWQDSAQSFVERAPVTSCSVVPWVGSAAVDDGA